MPETQLSPNQKRANRMSIGSFLLDNSQIKRLKPDDTSDLEISVSLEPEIEELVDVQLVERTHYNAPCWDYFNYLKLKIMNEETSEIRELTRHYCVYPDCTSSYSDTVSTGHLTKH